MDDNNHEIPPNVTIRQEYVKCGDPDCQNSHGPEAGHRYLKV